MNIENKELNIRETQEILNQPPKSLRSSPDIAKQWSDLANRTQLARLQQKQEGINAELARAADADPAAPPAPAFRLWIADNFAASNQWNDALKACDDVVDLSGDAQPLLPSTDIVRSAQQRRAEIAASAGNTDMAISAWRDLWLSNKESEYDVEGMLFAGLLAEISGRDDEAAELYKLVAAKVEGPGSTPSQLALRAARRLENSSEQFSPSVVACRSTILGALNDRNSTHLDECISSTHFSLGLVGGHIRFEDAGIRKRILVELREGNFGEGGALLGSGNKRYLFSHEWNGDLLRGTIGLIFVHAPRGWQCNGIALTRLPEELQERWKPTKTQKNQPLPFMLKSPWPAGRHFMAGGIIEFGIKAVAVAAAAAATPFGVGGAVLAGAFSASNCGFGPRGFYYNDLSPTHQDEDAFAIDFTRYRRGVPFDNESGGTAVLAPAPGIVATARGGRNSGDSSGSNTVEILHADPVTGNDSRFLSRYLHLAGPNSLPVSVMMPVITGQRLGQMNDTGDSVLDHLHFSIHDQTVPSGNVNRGASVRPTPMDGTSLGDLAASTCVISSNRERRPPPPDDAEFVSQSVPSDLKPLEQGSARITMRNTGPNTWTSGYKLVSRATGWTVDEVVIGQTVVAGETISINIPLLSFSAGDFGFQWQMARPLSGRFGQVTPRRTITVEDATNPQDCAALDRALAGAEQELEDWQDLLDEIPPSGKPEIIDQINRVRAQIAAINRQKARAGCP